MGIIVDLTNNGNNITPANGNVRCKGFSGDALSVIALNTIPNISAVRFANAYSLEFLLKYISGSGIIWQYSAVASDRNGCSMAGNTLKVGNYNGTSYIGLYNDLVINKWYHVIFTNNNRTRAAYLNGVAFAVSDTPSLASEINIIGNGGISFSIDEARVYNRVIGVEEAKSKWNKYARRAVVKEDYANYGADGAAKVPSG